MSEKKSIRSRIGGIFKKICCTKIGFISVVFPLFIVGVFGGHEVAIRHFPEMSCTVCHEMKDPVEKWKASGTSKNHSNCVDCHFDAGIQRMWEVNREAVEFSIKHFQRDPDEPIKPPEEPLFLEEGRDPGYYSLVPNYRCFQCHEAKNHKQSDQQRIHSKLIDDISKRPCKDCHNHEMRKGQKFYEQIVTNVPPANGESS